PKGNIRHETLPGVASRLIRLVFLITHPRKGRPYPYSAVQPSASPSKYSSLWCGREDSNFHGIAPTATSTLRVYQFRHDRTTLDLAW
ncbi:uncharacterized protein METZ01_LOCUS309164, partial [marine metagenome]